MSQEVLPVTKAEMTSTEIEYSVKVGKQVVKKQLEKEIKQLLENLSEEGETRDKIFSGSKFCKMLEEEAEKQLEADKDLSTIREILSKYMFEEDKFKNNLDMMCGSINAWPLLCLVRGEGPGYRQEHIKRLSEFIEGGVANVAFEFGFYERSDAFGEKPKVCYEIPLSETWIDVLNKYLNSLKRTAEITDNMAQLTIKLNNLDSLMEEVEASILANELKKTESGRKVLSISSGIISSVLGTTPELLKIE